MTSPTRNRGYNSRTIKSILRKKLSDWLESIEDESLRELCKRDAIVTGGCIVSLLQGEKPNDFDLYFENYETTCKVAEYYVDKFKLNRQSRGGVDVPMEVQKLLDVRGKDRVRIIVKSAGIERESNNSDSPDYQYFEAAPADSTNAADYVADVMDDPGEIVDTYEETRKEVQNVETTAQDKKEGRKPYRPRFLSSNAITLADGIQVVLRFYGDPDAIHSTFDFVHCTCWYRCRDGHLELPSKALTSILSKTLQYQGSLYPVCSVMRVRKFVQRGWVINAGQILKMCLQISNLNLNDFNVLEDQLTGVDVAYFKEVLDKAKDKDSDKVDQAYLVEIIDRMFD